MPAPGIHRSLGELLRGLDGLPFGDWTGVTVSGIAIDSREVQPGDLFIALPGRLAHGARYLGDAIRRGARAAVVPPDTAPPAGVPGLRAADGRRVLARVAARFYGDPTRELFVAGVTGTNGKSTFVHMAAHVLRARGWPAGYWSTPEVWSGARRFRPVLTTPEAHELQRFFREVHDAGMRHACIEVSSHGVVQGRVDGVRFDVGAVTNITPDHLDYHRDFADYFAAKRAFVEGLDAAATCFLNADDPWVRRMGDRARARIVTYGFGEDATLRAADPVYTPHGTRFTVRVAGDVRDALGRSAGAAVPDRFEMRLAVPGRHNVLNALAALGTGLVAGVPLDTLTGALKSFKAPPRRLETQRIGPYTVINDVAMNEASYEAVMETMAQLRRRPLVVVNAVRGNRGPEVNARIAEVLARWDKRLGFAPLILSESRSHVAKYEADYRVRPEELRAFVEAAGQSGLALSVHQELPDAIAEGVDRLEPGGVLLLLGTFGMDEGHFLAADLLRRRVEVTAPSPR